MVSKNPIQKNFFFDLSFFSGLLSNDDMDFQHLEELRVASYCRHILEWSENNCSPHISQNMRNNFKEMLPHFDF